MNVLIVCVNFNSYKELDLYLDSINEAVKTVQGVCVEVCVADNSIDKKDISSHVFSHIKIRQICLENLGYLPAACHVINREENIREYDYVVISNVDLTIDKSFFRNLQSCDIDTRTGMIAPMIWTEQEGRDKNPKVLERYTKSKLNKIRLLYKFPVLDYIYSNTLYLKKKSRPVFPEMNIYAGHGSFMMLTKNFFSKYSTINYPIFLFGEELYLAELNRIADLSVRYIPSLKVIDKEHTSTSKMKKSQYYKMNLESIDYIIENFYE